MFFQLLFKGTFTSFFSDQKEPDPGGPKIYGSYESGSATLLPICKIIYRMGTRHKYSRYQTSYLPKEMFLAIFCRSMYILCKLSLCTEWVCRYHCLINSCLIYENVITWRLFQAEICDLIVYLTKFSAQQAILDSRPESSYRPMD